jgi:hypothetical protein
MKHVLSSFITLFTITTAFTQKTTVTSEILKAKQITELFPDTVLSSLNIKYPIYRVYRYSDKGGQYYHKKIKAVAIKDENGSFNKTWEINDNIIDNGNNEYSIRFWTKYVEFRDYDGDGLIDPVITYGSFGMNGYDDGRVKFIIYHKGQKIAIRHQNGVLDNERETQVDKAFYDLPQSLQTVIKQKMELMTENEHAIFPAGWQKAMQNKKTSFNERGK